jgi:hypothetical protein
MSAKSCSVHSDGAVTDCAECCKLADHPGASAEDTECPDCHARFKGKTVKRRGESPVEKELRIENETLKRKLEERREDEDDAPAGLDEDEDEDDGDESEERSFLDELAEDE